MQQRQAAIKSLGFLIIGYWALFWLLNGLDKFLCRTDLGPLTWFGNHREEKFTMYMDRLGFGDAIVNPTLVFAGIWELAIAALCAYAMVVFARPGPVAPRMLWSIRAVGATIITFIGFCIFDVVVGDRAELLEHSTYIGVAVVSYMLLALEPVFAELHRDLTSEGQTSRHI